MPKPERTEQPTQRRLTDARRKGQVARSMDAAGGASFLVAIGVATFVVPSLGRTLLTLWRQLVLESVGGDPGAAARWLAWGAGVALVAIAPLVLASAAASVAVQIALGSRFNVAGLKPKLSHLSPRQGIKRIFSKQAGWEALRTTFKLAALAFGAWLVMQSLLPILMRGPAPITGSLAALGRAVMTLGFVSVGVAVLAGASDAVVSVRRHRGQLKMTKQEVKDDTRQSEGNPEIKGAIRRRQQSFTRSRMITEVVRADVVVTNPTHYAVALRYDDGDAAPEVLAKGAGVIAARIREEARAHAIPIREQPVLARALWRTVEVGDKVPEELYVAVAEVLAAVYRTPTGAT